MENKKPTNAQLTSRIKNSPLHLDRTADTKSIYFSDKGLRLTYDDKEMYTLIATNYHTHVFNNFNGDGVSAPYMFTKRVVEIMTDLIAEIENGKIEGVKKEDVFGNGYQFETLKNILEGKEDKTDYYVVSLYGQYLFNIFMPLYSIGLGRVESFMVYEDFMHNVARNSILLSEKTDDMTNKEFIKSVYAEIKKFTDDVEEYVLFPKKSDEEVMKENIDAIMQQETEDFMKEKIAEEDGRKD